MTDRCLSCRASLKLSHHAYPNLCSTCGNWKAKQSGHSTNVPWDSVARHPAKGHKRPEGDVLLLPVDLPPWATDPEGYELAHRDDLDDDGTETV